MVDPRQGIVGSPPVYMPLSRTIFTEKAVPLHEEIFAEHRVRRQCFLMALFREYRHWRKAIGWSCSGGRWVCCKYAWKGGTETTVGREVMENH